MPLTGGTVKGDTTVLGSNGQYGVKLTNGDIQFVSDGGSSVVGTITGISDSTGTSSTVALSQKGASANYLANSGGTISGDLSVDGIVTVGANKAEDVVTLFLKNKNYNYETHLASDGMSI